MNDKSRISGSGKETRTLIRRDTLFRFATVFFIIFPPLFITEISLRVFNLAPRISKGANIFIKDRYLPYLPRPYSKIYLELWTGEKKFLCEHNSVGLRDEEHSFNKPDGVFRILALGDSYTYGLGVDFRESYLARLEDMLNKIQGRHPKVEIIKAGIPAFFPEPERIFLEHYGVKYHPDLILVAFLPNDVIDTYSGFGSLRVEKNGYLEIFSDKIFFSIFRFLYRYSYLCRLVIRFFTPWFTLKYCHWVDVYKNNGQHEGSWKKVESEYSNMHKIANNIGAKLVIIHIPELKRNLGDINWSYPAARLSNWCRNNGVFFIDTLVVFEKNKMNSLYWKEGHCNSLGHKIIAETIYFGLIKENLVP
ncbi:MAG: hypothetical protein NTU54_00835 [Candidatus Omnitrophica bacterium]|nr:hypothetical protein [Candidatus Omnitrophota bacterium]